MNLSCSLKVHPPCSHYIHKKCWKLNIEIRFAGIDDEMIQGASRGTQDDDDYSDDYKEEGDDDEDDSKDEEAHT